MTSKHKLNKTNISNNKKSNNVSDTPRTEEANRCISPFSTGDEDNFEYVVDHGEYKEMLELCSTLERELNAANKIIADAREYIEEWKEFPMDDLLWRILGGK